MNFDVTVNNNILTCNCEDTEQLRIIIGNTKLDNW